MKIPATTLCFLLIYILPLCAYSQNTQPQKKSTASTVRYTKINTQGKSVVKKSEQAACVKDNETELIWELKTDDESIHNKDNNYRWGGRGAEQSGTLFFDDWNVLIDATNKEKLCGFNDWRVPTIKELKSLVMNGHEPTIDTDYFPFTLMSAYWSASAYPNYPEHGQNVHFGTGVSYYYNGYRGDRLPVRLVRGNVL